MTAQQEHESQSTRPDSESKAAVEKTRAEAKAAQARVKAEEKARQKAEKALDEAREDLAALQVELERERQARSIAEQALAEAKKARQVEAGKTEQIHGEPGVGPSGPTVPPTPLSAPTEAPKPAQPAHLTVPEVHVFPLGDQSRMALVFNPEESFVIQARFQLHGVEAFYAIVKEFPFEIKVYAFEVNSGAYSLLSSYQAKWVKDTLEYTAQMQAQGLSPGLYSLLTVVTLHTPTKISSHHKGPFIQVGEIRI